MKRILAAALLILSTATVAFGQCSEADKQKLTAWDKELSEVTRAADRTRLAAAYADDFAGMNPWGMVNKATAVENAVRNAEREKAEPQNAPQVSYDYYDITCSANMAVVVHRNVSTVMRDGKEQTSYSRSVHILEKRGGNWLLVNNAGSPLDDAGQLLYMEREWNDASIKRDAAWFERNYAGNVTDISGRTGKLSRKADVINSIKNDKDVLESAELSEMNVRVQGDTAVVTGVNHVKGRDDKGQPFDRRVRFTDVFGKRDGRWQVLATQGTDIR